MGKGGETLNRIEFIKANKWGLIFPLVLLIISLLFRNQLYGVFGEDNYVVVHLLMEIFIIVVSFTIAIQAWLIFPYILSSHRLNIGALFLALGLLEVVHALSYAGMPFFIEESSPYTATWFYMIIRVSQALGLLMILTMKHKKVHRVRRWIAYSLACLYAFGWMVIIYYPTQLLPELVIPGEGLTVLKIGMQCFAIILQVILILYLLKHFQANQTHNTMIIMASLYLILSDSMFISYKSVYDIANFIGHLFQLTGYYYIIRALYYSSVEEPFQALIATERQLKRSEGVLHFKAYHDELTKLPNSRYFSERLSASLKTAGMKKAVMMIEIDRFKPFNESLGHSFGDLILQKTAKRLRDSLSSMFFISKLRGEEFTIIVDRFENEKEIINLCEQIQELMKEPFQIQHFLLNIKLNIGVAIYPDHGENDEQLLRHAQVAMREAQKVTERYVFYRLAMGKQLVERLMLEHDLHHAVENGELFLEYQPQVNLQTGEIYAVEALVRWKHPEKGWISPGAFIPIAEETGLIVPIGEWILETACKQTKKWHDEGIPNIGVAVNLSIRQFFQQNLVQMVKDILERTNLAPSYLELEITESMTMDTRHTIQVLQDLKKLGVKIAVDDFGTGYSSMSYLKDFPIDRLKIDRSFINQVQSNSHDGALISMIISMAKHLQLQVVAEGVEEVDQLAFLTERDCDSIQGYLFSKPISPEEISTNFDEIQKRAVSLAGLEESYLRD